MTVMKRVGASFAGESKWNDMTSWYAELEIPLCLFIVYTHFEGTNMLHSFKAHVLY